jgi:hypothetical protein
MKTILRHAGLLAGAAFVLSAGTALAGDPPKPADGRKVEKTERRVVVRGGPGGPRGHMMNPEARAQHLRDVLQLRPDQEPALKAYLEATTPKMRVRKADPDGKPGPGAGEPGKPPERRALTTPERLDMQAKMMAARQAAFEKRAAATRTFYAALSPSQQKAFDALHARGGRMGGPGRRVIRMGGPGGDWTPKGAPGEPMAMQAGPEAPVLAFAMIEAGDEDMMLFGPDDGGEIEILVGDGAGLDWEEAE